MKARENLLNYEKGFLVKHRFTALLDESSAVILLYT